MLRVTVREDEQGTAFKLEGKLAHEWVAEAERAWTAFSNIPRQGRVTVDLCGVSFVDDVGRELLVRMHASGAKLVGSGPMTSALIEEVCGGPSNRRSKWMRGVLSLFLLLVVNVVPRDGVVPSFLRSAPVWHAAVGIRGWVFALQVCVTHLWKGLL